MKNNIDIKDPCSEDWANMTPTDKGAFCHKCAKEVHNFSNKSGNEIRNVLKLNLGSSVCGKLRPSQIEELNHDFESWSLNNRRTFQSALVFSLIVAFGMTLFGCEEDKQRKQINEIQSIGMAQMLDEVAPTDKASNHPSIEKKVKMLDAIELMGPVTKRMIEPAALEKLRDEPKLIQAQEIVRVTDVFMEVTADGGIGYSMGYAEYLEDIEYVEPDLVGSIYPDLIESIVIEKTMKFSAITFPNPAVEKTTLQLTMPNEELVVIKLFSISGQFIQDVSSKELRMGETKIEIDLVSFPKGIYIISIVSNSFNESVKFIKK